MEILANLLDGLLLLMHPQVLFACFIGVLIGTIVGVLPGLGPVAAISMLLPVTIGLAPISAIIMIAGIYYGAMYGGSTTSILLNLPGEAASVVTCIDGYKMALQGRAGSALGIAAFGSFIASTITIIALMLVAPPLAEVGLAFGPPEYFSLILCGLTLVTFLAKSGMLKALTMASAGIFIGIIGTDTIMGSTRFTMGITELTDGVGLIPVVMGLFGIAEVLNNIEKVMLRAFVDTKIQNLLPTVRDWKDSTFPILRGSIIGFFIGLLPGGGGVLSTFTSYAVEKGVSKHPEKFGEGCIEGVAGPESANNSASIAGFIPLLTLGIPSSATIAIIYGALMMYGLQPGPLLIKEHPDMFWGLIASMYLGNIMLLILNLPLIGLWVKILKIPYPILFPLILIFCLIGAYSLNNNVAEVLIMIFFGFFGYIMNKFEYETAPLVLALVLGSRLEVSLRRSLLLQNGDLTIFFTRPISAIFIIIAIMLVVIPLLPKFRKVLTVLPKENPS